MVSKMREVCASEQHSVVSGTTPFCKNVTGCMYMYVGTSVEGQCLVRLWAGQTRLLLAVV